jgi:hypothetical protein
LNSGILDYKNSVLYEAISTICSYPLFYCVGTL